MSQANFHSFFRGWPLLRRREIDVERNSAPGTLGGHLKEASDAATGACRRTAVRNVCLVPAMHSACPREGDKTYAD